MGFKVLNIEEKGVEIKSWCLWKDCVIEIDGKESNLKLKFWGVDSGSIGLEIYDNNELVNNRKLNDFLCEKYLDDVLEKMNKIGF